MMLCLTRRSALAGLLTMPFCRSAAYACDDPPNHYEEPCRAAHPADSPYCPVADGVEAFAAAGVKVELRPTEPAMMQAAIGSEPIVEAYGAQAIDRFVKQADFRVIATPKTTIALGVWKAKGSGADLTAARLAVSSASYSARLAVQQLVGGGTVKEEDLAFLDPDELAAIARSGGTGPADALLLTRHLQPVAADGGLEPVLDIKVDYAVSAFAAPLGILDDDRNAGFLRGFLRAIGQSIAFMQDSRDAAIDLLAQRGFATDPAAAVDFFADASREISADRKALGAVLQAMALAEPGRAEELAGVDLDALVDSRFVAG